MEVVSDGIFSERNKIVMGGSTPRCDWLEGSPNGFYFYIYLYTSDFVKDRASSPYIFPAACAICTACRTV